MWSNRNGPQVMLSSGITGDAFIGEHLLILIVAGCFCGVRFYRALRSSADWGTFLDLQHGDLGAVKMSTVCSMITSVVFTGLNGLRCRVPFVWGRGGSALVAFVFV